MRMDNASRPTWSIGAVARQTGLPVKVVRHWSDVGVVAPVSRTAGGYRRYDTAGVARLQLARTLRDLGMGLGEIRAALDREDGLTEVAAAHVEALEAQIRRLRTHQAVLRTVTRRTTHEGLALMTRTAHMYPDERRKLVHDFLTNTLGDLEVPHFREGLLAAGSDLPEDPTDEQIEAWLELGELVADGELRPAMRRIAEYAARHGQEAQDSAMAEEMRALTGTWTARVREAMQAGIAADSPAADQVVADIIAAWLPSRANTAPAVTSDGTEARTLLHEQLTIAAEPAVERFWQLLCILGGRPAPPGIAEEGQWLATAVRANPAPGARNARLEALYTDDTDPWPDGVVDAFTRVQDTTSCAQRRRTSSACRLPAKTGPYGICLTIWCGRTSSGAAWLKARRPPTATPRTTSVTITSLPSRPPPPRLAMPSDSRACWTAPSAPPPAVAWSNNSSSSCSCMAGTSRPRSATTATWNPTSRVQPCRSSGRSTATCPAPPADPSPQRSPHPSTPRPLTM
ncbi:helix-turn-helix domain-containing protein [Streptomyces lydicus]